MGKFLDDVLLSLAWVPVFVAAGFLLLFLSRKYKIAWLTKFLTRPSKQDRPPGWLVIVAGILLVALTVTWFALPVERRLILRNHLLGP